MQRILSRASVIQMLTALERIFVNPLMSTWH